VHIPTLVESIFGYLGKYVPSSTLTEMQRTLESNVVNKFTQNGQTKVSRCEFQEAMYQSQKTGTMLAGKLPTGMTGDDDDTVVAHG